MSDECPLSIASTDANVVLNCSAEVHAHIDLVEAKEVLREPSEEHEYKDSQTKKDRLVHDAQSDVDRKIAE